MSDLISRQAAIDAVMSIKRTDNWKASITMALFDLPSAQPKPGEWTNKGVFGGDGVEEWQECQCSECKRWDTRPYMYYFDEPKFCSFCGAKMGVKE